MRKIAQFHDTDKPYPKALLPAVDVSSRKLDLYSRYRQDGTEYELVESFSNDLTTIADRLEYFATQALGLGYCGLATVVEPSGRYGTKLTRAALQRGHRRVDGQPGAHVQSRSYSSQGRGQVRPAGREDAVYAETHGQARLVPLPEGWQRWRPWGQWREDATLAASQLRMRIGMPAPLTLCDKRC